MGIYIPKMLMPRVVQLIVKYFLTPPVDLLSIPALHLSHCVCSCVAGQVHISFSSLTVFSRLLPDPRPMETATQISEDQLAGLCEKLRECERTKDWDTAHDVLLELYNYHPTMKAVASCKIGVFLVHLQKIAPVRV